MRIGYALICGEHGPRALIDNARLAEEVGFEYLSLSDHFHPWLPAQGHSPFAWTVAVSDEGSIDVAARHGHVIVTSPDPDTIAAYRDAGSQGEAYGQATVCFADDRTAAERIMVERWRQSAFGWDVNAYLASVAAYRDAGFDAITVHNVGREQERFLRAVGRWLFEP